MSLLISAAAATLAAIVESSVLTQLVVDGVKPDLVLALTLGVAMVLGFEHGMVWAVVGGLMLDLLLPERMPGSTTLALLLLTGIALLVARATDPPRLLVIGVTVFVLSLAYQGLLMLLLAVTTGSAIRPIDVPSSVVIALLNTIFALAAAWIARTVAYRFGRLERVDW
jgi:rod shape-determining protein MreD